jgi:hypothetical protein
MNIIMRSTNSVDLKRKNSLRTVLATQKEEYPFLEGSIRNSTVIRSFPEKRKEHPG